MKEPIQQSAQEVSIVIYDSPLPPRYIRFSKKFIRTLFVVIPVALGLIFSGLILFGLGSRIKDTPVPKIPKVISSDESKILNLEAEIQSLKSSNEKLQEKLTVQVATTPAAEEPFLMGIKKPYGMQNLISQNKITLGQLELVQQDSKTNFKFQIISSNPDVKVSGHILVFMVSDSGLMAYPSVANASIAGGITFNMGEPFSVSRLRPTNAEFSLALKGNSAKFIIYIFSREGDLLLVKETESYKVGSK